MIAGMRRCCHSQHIYGIVVYFNYPLFLVVAAISICCCRSFSVFCLLLFPYFFASFFAPSLDGTMCTFPSHVCSVYVRAYTEMFTSHTRTHSLLISNTAHAITCCCSHNNTNTSRNAYGLSFHRSFSKQEKSKQRYDAMATAVAATL